MEVYHRRMRLVLASASPRRVALMKAAGFDFDICPVDIDERVQAGECPTDYVRRLAVAKSVARAIQTTHAIVIGADTAVVVDGEIFGKPADVDDARRMLSRLSGRTHQVVTGVAVHDGRRSKSHVEETDVEIAALESTDLQWYLNTGEWRDKAGAYAIQGFASRFVLRVHGSYTNVVGLPIAQLCSLLLNVARDIDELA